MNKKRIPIACLFIAAFIMLTLSVVPHHHHENGFLCIHLNGHIPQSQDAGTPCENNCIARFHQADRAPERQIHINLLLLSFAVCELPQFISSLFTSKILPGTVIWSIYRERLHPEHLIRHSGLRAPPFSIA
ncbi:DUF6769 family protein [Coprobacter tertius]|uniref:Uncharacterized protein n=1 Tax=Coprobacter tertius TaxID=2944915 RepID=A0ABT1MK12_9BACT|nr:DUF6769 family protein [Coprobacter tertius]MCP9611571.1 hypothetical protein [Coprobacter tertius]